MASRLIHTLTRHRALLLILAVSAILRVALVTRGGQFYYPDETRYLRSLKLVDRLADGNWGAAADILVGVGVPRGHYGYTIVGMIPAAAQGLAKHFFGLPLGAFWLPALLFIPASLLSIFLVYRVSLKLGGTSDEAFWAALLMACSNALFYPSRHLLPYDAAMALALAGLLLGLDLRAHKLRSFTVGMLVGSAFLTYFGFWIACLLVLLIHVLRAPLRIQALLARAIPAGIGALLPAMTLLGISRVRAVDLLGATKRFSSTVVYGDFSEGWSLPWAYLWHAEHALLALWILGLVLAVRIGLKRPSLRRGSLWAACAGGVYVLLVVTSCGLNVFVVYARLVRQVIPFLCLATGFSVHFTLQRSPHRSLLAKVLVASLAVQAISNFTPPLRQRYPKDVLLQAMHEYDDLSVAFTVEGPKANVGEELMGPSRYVLLNHRYLSEITGPKAPPPGKEVFRVRHPLEYRPEQYEGLTRATRRIARTHDISIRLVDTAEESP